MKNMDSLVGWLEEYESLSAQLAPLLARYATGGTNFDRKAVLIAGLQEQYREKLREDGDPRPSAAKIDQFVHSDSRFRKFIDETEAAREKLFRLSSQRQAVLFKIRRTVRGTVEDSEENPREEA